MLLLQLFVASAVPVLKICLVCGIGAVCARKGMLSPEGRRVLGALSFMVFNPALIFVKLASTLTPARLLHWWPLVLNTGIGIAVGLGLGYLVCRTLLRRPLRPDPGMEPVAVVCIALGNLGNLPLVIVASLASSPSTQAVLRGVAPDRAEDLAVSYVMVGLLIPIIVHATIGFNMLRKPHVAVLPTTGSSSTQAGAGSMPQQHAAPAAAAAATTDGAVGGDGAAVGGKAGGPAGGPLRVDPGSPRLPSALSISTPKLTAAVAAAAAAARAAADAHGAAGGGGGGGAERPRPELELVVAAPQAPGGGACWGSSGRAANGDGHAHGHELGACGRHERGEGEEERVALLAAHQAQLQAGRLGTGGQQRQYDGVQHGGGSSTTADGGHGVSGGGAQAQRGALCGPLRSIRCKDSATEVAPPSAFAAHSPLGSGGRAAARDGDGVGQRLNGMGAAAGWRGGGPSQHGGSGAGEAAGDPWVGQTGGPGAHASAVAFAHSDTGHGHGAGDGGCAGEGCDVGPGSGSRQLERVPLLHDGEWCGDGEAAAASGHAAHHSHLHRRHHHPQHAPRAQHEGHRRSDGGEEPLLSGGQEAECADSPGERRGHGGGRRHPGGAPGGDRTWPAAAAAAAHHGTGGVHHTVCTATQCDAAADVSAGAPRRGGAVLGFEPVDGPLGGVVPEQEEGEGYGSGGGAGGVGGGLPPLAGAHVVRHGRPGWGHLLRSASNRRTLGRLGRSSSGRHVLLEWHSKINYKAVARHVWREATSPPLLTILLSVPVGCIPALQSAFFGPSAPLGLVTDCLHMLGECTIPSILLILGATLANGPGAARVPLPILSSVTLLRLVLLPLVGLLLVMGPYALGAFEAPDPIYLLVLLIQNTAPTAIMAHTMASVQGNRAEEVSSILFWGYMAGIVVIPLWLTLFLYVVQQMYRG